MSSEGALLSELIISSSLAGRFLLPLEPLKGIGSGYIIVCEKGAAAHLGETLGRTDARLVGADGEDDTDADDDGEVAGKLLCG